jgi:histidinol-phosphate aminotransferase
LRRVGFEVPPSQANFVMARMPWHDLSTLVTALRNCGILVRYFATPGLRDAMRISIGTPAEMAALMRALRAMVSDARRETIGLRSAVAR